MWAEGRPEPRPCGRKELSVSVSARPGQGGCRQGRKMQERPHRDEQQQGMWASPGASVGSAAGPRATTSRPPSGVTPNPSSTGLSTAGCAACTHHHNLVLLLAAVLGQDGQDGWGQQDALQHVDHAIGSQHIHPPQRDALGSQQDAPLWQSPVGNTSSPEGSAPPLPPHPPPYCSPSLLLGNASCSGNTAPASLP